jgi:hypothetical protein
VAVVPGADLVVLIRDVPWQGLPTGPFSSAESAKRSQTLPAGPNSDIVVAFDARSGDLLFFPTVMHS